MSLKNSQGKRNQEQLEHKLSLYQTMVNAAVEPITLIDRNYTYRIVNHAYTEARNLKKEEVLNHTVADVWGEEVFQEIIKEKLDRCFAGNVVSDVSAYEFKKNEINYVETTYTPCFPSGPEASYVVVISHNITELKRSQEKLKILAYYDSLTSLPNRPLFMDRLEQEIKYARRNRTTIAVFFLDLDEFKKINDSYGHSAGDSLLVSVGDRLTDCVRNSDTIGRSSGVIRRSQDEPSGHFSRIGGDEFTLILPNFADKKYVATVAEKIISIFNEPFQVAGREVFISTSIGIALYPDNGDTVETLLKNADTAMYRAKEAGKNTFEYYSSAMNSKAKARIKLENELRRAIDNQEFLLYYQPQYDIDTGQLVGMESLIRWKNEKMGLVSPGEFIPLAEETGMIVPIGEWVIQSACRQGKIWKDQGYGNLHLGVNLSPRQFFDPHVVEKVQGVLDSTGFDPHFLEIEITETAMLQDNDKTVHILNALKEMGVNISLDDFGTGYSSLSHLKMAHIDTLKIDQTFILNANLEGRDGAIISAIIDLGRRLKIKVIAEGVETKESLAYLKKKNCHVAQGYLFSPPLPVDEFQKLLQERESV